MSDNPSLLVVDDDAAICEGCQRIFARQGFRVDGVSDPIEGLRMAMQGDYAVVLLDIKMPVLDGVQFLEKLRAKKPNLPVVVITAYPSISNAVSAVRLQAADYVTKPFTPDQITQAVQRVFAQQDAKARERARSGLPELGSRAPQPGEFRFWNESWLQLGREGTGHAGAMHQRMPDVSMALEGSMRVGAVVTPSQGATVKGVRLPQVGQAVCQGRPLATLMLKDGSQRDLPSPLGGVVVAVNSLLRESLWALWKDPFGDGWIACVSPTQFVEDLRNCKVRAVVLASTKETSARSQSEELTRLGCQVRIVTIAEELGPALQDPGQNVLFFDAVSFGEDGPELVGRVNADAPWVKVVVVASDGSQWEPAYREQRILYYAVEPLAENEILEILDAAFRPPKPPVCHAEYGQDPPETAGGAGIVNCGIQQAASTGNVSR